jgi:hypothetical protein
MNKTGSGLALAVLCSFFSCISVAASELGIVSVQLLVPQRKGCTDSFMIYPYPVKPPTNDKKLKPLPKTMKGLRGALFDSGYSGRTVASKAYPSIGWRWRYIFQTAVEKSKLPLPHTAVTAYTWLDEIVPYAIPELKKVNMAERARIMRYNKAVEFWDLNNVDLENAATQEGKHPYDISFNQNWVARARLPEGNWWVVGTHRVTSLVFYWQEPIKIVAGSHTNLNLDEWNALVVQGDW